MKPFPGVIDPSREMAPPRPARSLVGRFLLQVVFLAVAVALFIAYKHFSLEETSTLSTACLVGSAGFALAPVRALLHGFFALERQALHLVHGLGGLAMIGLTYGGVFSGQPLMTHAAMAPFAIMGAAQAIMHQDHPRNAEQAAALQRFATSLPEIESFTKGDLASPENARRAVVVLTDLVGKAEALGETELRADPNFQSALAQATTRFGLSLGLDAIDQAIGNLSHNPAVAKQIPDLRRQLAAARKTVGE